MSLTRTRIVTEHATSIALPRTEAIPPLDRQEKIIRDALGKAIKEVGAALMVIHDQRLYREAGFSRFENYCEQVWGFKGSRAYQYIDYHKVIREFSTNVETRGMPLPRTEAQTRPLLRLASADSCIAVWRDVLDKDGERATKAQVEDAVDYRLAIEANAAWRKLPRDVAIQKYRERKVKSRRVRPRAQSMPEPRTSSSDDASVRVTLGSVNRMLDGIFAAPREWIAALEEHERPKVNDLIGDLLLLADALENALDSFKDRAHTRCGEEDSDDVSQ